MTRFHQMKLESIDLRGERNNLLQVLRMKAPRKNMLVMIQVLWCLQETFKNQLENTLLYYL